MIPSTSSNLNTIPEQRITVLEQELTALQERLAQLEKNTIQLDKLLQPWVGFIAACVFTAGFALLCFAVFKGQELSFYLSYFVPIAFPFTGFVFDRLSRYFQKTAGIWGILTIGLDIIVVVTALIRAVYSLQYISGHALFLTFALLTVKSRWVRIPVILVLIEVIYLKVFAWHDSTIYGGALLGCLTGVVWWGLIKKTKKR